MSQAHIDRVLKELNDGLDPEDQVPVLSKREFNLGSAAVQTIRDMSLDWQFVPQSAYCPFCDIPSYATKFGANYSPSGVEAAILLTVESLGATPVKTCFLLRRSVPT